MRILFIADEFPWPQWTGYRQRLSFVLRTLVAEGTVDFLAVVVDDSKTLTRPPADLQLLRSAVVYAGGRAEQRVARLARWVTSRRPRALLWRDWEAPRATLAAWSDTPYDLVWFSHAASYLALSDLVSGRHVVDLDNLESSVLRHRRQSRLNPRTRRSRQLLAALPHAVADAVDERRWRRLEREIADDSDLVVVCSELDRERLGRARVSVVPNGYELALQTPTSPIRGRSAGPVLIMVGLLTYEPNRDGAAHLAADILPLVRRRCPDAQFHVVGRHGGDTAVASWRGLSGVAVLGEVADVGAELAAADIAVVPIRFGGGTRIKILEAFAHRIPVVSTTVGCEGLDVVDGEHLLVADGPEAFAAACIRLHENADLRDRLVGAAAQLWERRYRWTVLTPMLAAAVQTAVTGTRQGQTHPSDQADHDVPRAGSANQ